MDLANHGLILLQQLNAQREFGFLCDCTVAIGDVYFKAHKSVLASFSNYFKMLFVHQTSECVRLKSTDIQPDIFSYLLHLMYTGKMAPQLIDPVRLEQGIKFLHAFPLIQEASLASHAASLEENSMEESPNEEQNNSLTIAHVKPSIMKRNGSFPKYYACHLCGRRFNLRSSLREHLQLHTGIPFTASTGQTETSISPSFCNNGAEMGKESMETTEAGGMSDSDMPQISDSPIIDGQQQSDTPPPTDIADIDNLEQADQEREVKRRKYECTICGRKFIQKSHWREHMYIHTGKPFKCSTCDKSFCRANQAARHVCLKSSDTYTVVDKQTLELCSFDEGSQMDNMLVQTNKRYKCNLCDKTFSTPNEVVKHTCQAQNSDVFALEAEGKSILLSSGDSEPADNENSMLTSIKKEQESVLD
ncbi:zinc finger and BTB domain-containing 2 [Pelobates cultripes]|uniref:Zinc finger and BTB domain-containing 2 n=1 Tax=Pelobates cultripes TaxID=61616 RepID=A0AAD1VUN7_PELCU|nr:zinc finger and BTB domain-containing 2 [Pelobates cultripes]